MEIIKNLRIYMIYCIKITIYIVIKPKFRKYFFKIKFSKFNLKRNNLQRNQQFQHKGLTKF